MAQFYRGLFERKLLVQRLKLDAASVSKQPLTLFKAIQAYSRQHDPKNQIVLFRLPQAELKTVAETPCPVNAPPSNYQPQKRESNQLEETQLIIASSKRLRSLFQLPEQRTCAVCPFAETCS